MAAPKLKELISPSHTAVLTMESQRGVVGDLAELPQLADAARQKGSLKAASRLLKQARSAGVQVVHATAENYPGGAGASRNCRLLSAGEGWLQKGDPATEVVPELEPQAGDIWVSRAHGVTPFTSTSLDQVLRNIGIKTIVATGQSLNVGLTGMVISAVDLGYQVVVPKDAVVGIPIEYGEEVIQNTLWYLATICESSELISIWEDD